MSTIPGTCDDCGCAKHECECLSPSAHQEAVLKKINGFLLTWEKPGDSFRCFDCLGRNSGYMVHDHVWSAAWPNTSADRQLMHQRAIELKLDPKVVLRQYLCFPCLEARLGRVLSIGDFGHVPINEGIRLGYRLGLASQIERELV